MEKYDYVRTFEEYYVEDQVLITGPVSHIEEVVRAADRVLPDPLWQLQWESLAEGRSECIRAILPYLEACEGPLETRLYSIRQQGQVRDVVGLVNDPEFYPCVRADPNWLTGYPYSAAGSPYSAAGSPYSAAGSASTEHGGPAGPDDFRFQWALERIGLIHESRRTIDCLGRGVRVGVFDTSPFASESTPDLPYDGYPPYPTVVHPGIFDHYPLPPPPDPVTGPGVVPPDPPDLSSHGLSVAGLVYAVAPESDIYLYRVLDKHARGNLFVLCHALIEFMNDYLPVQDKLNGGIINLSLGVPLPAERKMLVGAEDVFALDMVLALAHCLGLTVVAAAGNGSAESSSAEPAEFPASQPYAIGVMASNFYNDRSCFSNAGAVTAPGGDGYNCGKQVQPAAAHNHCMCPWDKADPGEKWKYGLIGPVLPSKKFPKGFARWTGTSFATPLVSGLAALLLENQGPPPSVIEPADVLVGATHVPASGLRIINVPGCLGLP